MKDEDFPATAGMFFKRKGHVFKDIKRYKNKIGKSDQKYPDENVIRVSTEQDCILLSKDHDYEHNPNLVELIRQSPGVVVWVLPNPDKKIINQLAGQTLKEINKRNICGQVLKISVNSCKRITPKRK